MPNFVVAHEIDDRTIANLVTDRDPAMAALGRLFATGIHQTMQDWLNAESARGTPADTMLLVLNRFATAQVAAVAVAVVRDGHEGALFDVLAKNFRRELGSVAEARRRHEAGR